MMIRWLSRFRKEEIGQATRRNQLRRVGELARAIRDTYEANGEPNFARAFNDLAIGAQALRDNGFDQAALSMFSSTMPGGPSWLDSRSPDFNGPREPWQEALVFDYWECKEAVLQLRVIGEQ
jgi:hypothetical protein